MRFLDGDEPEPRKSVRWIFLRFFRLATAVQQIRVMRHAGGLLVAF